MLYSFTKTSRLAVQPSEPRSQINRHHELSLWRKQSSTDSTLLPPTGNEVYCEPILISEKHCVENIYFIVLKRKQCIKNTHKWKITQFHQTFLFPNLCNCIGENPQQESHTWYKSNQYSTNQNRSHSLVNHTIDWKVYILLATVKK